MVYSDYLFIQESPINLKVTYDCYIIDPFAFKKMSPLTIYSFVPQGYGILPSR